MRRGARRRRRPARGVPARGLRALLLLGLGLASACGGPSATGIPDAEVPALLAGLVSDEAARVDAAAERIESADDERFAAVLVELLRASQLGIAGRTGYNRRVVALERITGASLGGDWFAWSEWLAARELGVPPGFGAFKAALFAELDPAFAELLDPERPSRLRLEDVQWGGVPLGGIPALDDPATVAADEAGYLAPGEPVVGLAIGDDARAYPLRILDWHELVNDRVGGVPVSIAYCTLCGSAIVYDGRVGDGDALRFDTSGLLLGSNKLMVDRDTRTLWSQLTGRAVHGPAVAEDGALRALPSVVARFGDWRARHPDTRVLSLDTGHERAYRPGQPYGGYFASDDPLFPVSRRRDELPAKARVYGLVRGGEAVAFPLAALARAGVTAAAAGGDPLWLVATEGRIEVEGESELAGPVRYDAGGAVRAYRREDERLGPGPAPDTLLDADGGAWRVTEDALVGPAGQRRDRVPGTLAYWFAWQAFHPDTRLEPGAS